MCRLRTCSPGVGQRRSFWQSCAYSSKGLTCCAIAMGHPVQDCGAGLERRRRGLRLAGATGVAGMACRLMASARVLGLLLAIAGAAAGAGPALAAELSSSPSAAGAPSSVDRSNGAPVPTTAPPPPTPAPRGATRAPTRPSSPEATAVPAVPAGPLTPATSESQVLPAAAFTLQDALALPAWLQIQAELQADPLGNPVGGLQQAGSWIQALTLSLVAGGPQSRPEAQWREQDRWQVNLNVMQLAGNPNLNSWIGAAFSLQQVADPTGLWLSGASLQRLPGERGIGLQVGILSLDPVLLSAPVFDFYLHGLLDSTFNINIPDFPISPAAAVGGIVEWKASPAFSVRYGLFDLGSVYRLGGLFRAPVAGPGGTGLAHLLQVTVSPKALVGPEGTSVPACRVGRGLQPARAGCARPVAVQRQLPPGGVVLGGYSTSGSGDGQGLYGVITLPVPAGPGLDQRLWLAASQATAAPNNPSPSYLAGGWLVQGILPQRPLDLLVLGVGSGGFNPSLQPGSGRETALELGYNVAVNSGLSLQPTVQWIVNPGGLGQVAPILALGLQLTLQF